MTAKPVLARRFESVTEQFSRLWDHTRVAEVWDAPPVPLEDVDLKVLQSLNGQSVEGVAETPAGRRRAAPSRCRPRSSASPSAACST